MHLPAPNRIAVYLTATANLLGALSPAIANLDTTSTAGIAVGLLGINAVVLAWLKGWQNHEWHQTFEENTIRNEDDMLAALEGVGTSE